jgi:hypothetical protein
MIRAVVCGTILALCGVLSGGARAAEEWKAGAGSVVITPEQDMWLSGYASRKAPSAGKIHDLHAKAIVFEDAGGAKSAIVTTDLIGMTKALSDETARIVKEKFGIPRERLMVTASHTHCGPVLGGSLEVMFDLDAEQSRRVAEYTRALPGKMADAVARAVADLGEARLEWTQGEAGFAVNRRQYTLGGVVIGVNPIGPVDRSVPVLVARRPDGSIKAVLFGYACHNTTLSFQQICGDYAGFAQAYLEEKVPGATALFVEGCGGDANPNPRGTLELAQQHGEALGQAVLTVAGTRLGLVRGPIHAAFREVSLALSAAPSREALEAQSKDEDVYIARRAKRLLSEWDAKGSLATAKAYPVQVWRFGDGLQMVALGGEVTVDYALRLKYEFGAERTFVIGYANDVMAYIPSLRVLREGGYEADTSNIYYGLYGPWAPTIEETIIGAVHELAGH